MTVWLARVLRIAIERWSHFRRSRAAKKENWFFLCEISPEGIFPYFSPKYLPPFFMAITSIVWLVYDALLSRIRSRKSFSILLGRGGRKRPLHWYHWPRGPKGGNNTRNCTWSLRARFAHHKSNRSRWVGFGKVRLAALLSRQRFSPTLVDYV